MLTRRGFAACAVTGLATSTEAQNAPGGLKRTIITRTGGPMNGYETVDVRVDLDGGALVARHTHPGIDSSYVVDGAMKLNVDGRGTRTFGAGTRSKCLDGSRIAAKIATSLRFSRSPTSLRRASPSPRRLEDGRTRKPGP